MRLHRLCTGLILLAVVACGAESPPTATPKTAQVGVQQIRFALPAGWLHADHGPEQRFEKDMARMSLVDLGPATPEGFAETLREARTLYERGQWEDARVVLMASNPRHFFASERRWKAIEGDWKSVTWIRRVEQPDGSMRVDGEVDWTVRGAYHDLLVRTSALAPPSVVELAERALPDLDHSSQRSIASSEAAAISGHAALRLDTWDRLSHLGRRQHLFVLANGRLLCLRTEMGLTEELAPAFEDLVASLEIEPSQGAASDARGSAGGS